ncbi:MAG TPA: hypothetical protein VFZ01_11095 [Geminicoccaceae bacterium]
MRTLQRLDARWVPPIGPDGHQRLKDLPWVPWRRHGTRHRQTSRRR